MSLDTALQVIITITLTLIVVILKQIAASNKESREKLEEHIKEDTRRFELVNDNLSKIKVAIARKRNGKRDQDDENDD